MVVNQTSLKDRAIKLYPEDPNLQEKWIQAINVLRQTTCGWILDSKIEKRNVINQVRY